MRLPVPRPRSLAGQLFAMQAVLIAVLVAGYALFTYVSDRSQAEEAAGRQATAVARSVADAPSVLAAIRTPRPTAALQPYALRVQRDTGVDFVTIMNPKGIRWTHPDEDQIGQHFRGHIGRALKGESFTEVYTGTLGPSVRAVTPIEDEDKRIVGLVSAGIKVEAISKRVQDQVTALLGVAAGALALGAIGTYVINARLRRHTHGMNAAELSHMHDYHQAALHAVREGLLMLDAQYRVALINDGGRELLGVTGDVVGRSVAVLGLPAPLTGALLASEPRVDEVHLTAERVLVVNTSPVSGGERRGSVVTLRDVTELQSMMGELDSERGFTQALRSQAHEAANRLHTVVSLIELGRSDEAVDFATAELELAQALTDQVVAAVGEPVLAALLLGKTAQANERGVELVVSEDSSLDDGLLPPSLPARDLVTILGNLIDNAVDAAQGSVPGRVTVTAYSANTDAAELVLRVSDTGTGVDPAHAEAVFQRGFSTKPAGPGGRGLGLALVRQAVNRHGGTLSVSEAEGGGAEFEVRLPLGDRPDPADTPENARPGRPTEASPPGLGTESAVPPRPAEGDEAEFDVRLPLGNQPDPAGASAVARPERPTEASRSGQEAENADPPRPAEGDETEFEVQLPLGNRPDPADTPENARPGRPTEASPPGQGAENADPRRPAEGDEAEFDVRLPLGDELDPAGVSENAGPQRPAEGSRSAQGAAATASAQGTEPAAAGGAASGDGA